jgi:hypothetical protein
MVRMSHRIGDERQAAEAMERALQTAVDLFEMDDETNNPATDAFVWLYHARAALKQYREASR